MFGTIRKHRDLRALSLVMATRLKSIREAAGLSHVALSEKLKEKYNVEISRDSLMNYEISEASHKRGYKNEGMRAEYLKCLADYFEVSSDWLLGLSDVESPDKNIEGVCEFTGLSEHAVEWLHIFSGTEYQFAALLSGLIEDNALYQEMANAIDTAVICQAAASSDGLKGEPSPELIRILMMKSILPPKTLDLMDNPYSNLPKGIVPVPARDACEFFTDKATRLFRDFAEWYIDEAAQAEAQRLQAAIKEGNTDGQH